MSTKNTLLLGTRKGFLVYKKCHGKWQFDSQHHVGVPVSIAAADTRNGCWWSLEDHGHWGGKINRSFDEGKTWEAIDPPIYPEGEEIKDGVDATLKYMWAFNTGGTDQPGRIYIGTEPGGLFVSDDGGTNFTLNRPLWDHPTRKSGWFGGGRDNPGIHSVIVDPADNRHIYVGISCAGVLETTDEGKSWTLRNKGLKANFLPDPASEVGQDPHILVHSPSNPQVMWQQNHCGIFRSVDGGRLWTDITDKEGGPANFGFCMAADEQDDQVAWVVPGTSDEIRVAVDGALCVCRTDDGGKSWKKITKGLPQQNCYDIVYRHCLDIDGDTLVFGTTTGNLFISEDRGESWETLSNFLPMVYSVKFV